MEEQHQSSPVAAARRAYLQARKQAAQEAKIRTRQRNKALKEQMRQEGKKSIRRWATDEQARLIDIVLKMTTEDQRKIMSLCSQIHTASSSERGLDVRQTN